MRPLDGPTRRQAIGIGVTAAASAAVLAGSTGLAKAQDWGAIGRVRGVSGGVADVDLLAGLAGNAPDHVVGRAELPLVGFPEALVPRTGDRVAVSRTTPGYEVAALPLGHWVTGVPRALGDGSFVLAGERAFGVPGLAAAGEAGSIVTACLLDTDLAIAQVLDVRAADAS